MQNRVCGWEVRCPVSCSQGWTGCKLLSCSAGVAQHKQGDLEAALQAFASASADALSAAGLSEAALSSQPAQGFLDSSHASNSSGGEPGAQSHPEAAASSSSDGGVQVSALAERTAVRALMAQASVLKRSGRLPDAVHALTLAAVLDRGVEVHAQKLRAEIKSSDPNKGASNITEP